MKAPVTIALIGAGRMGQRHAANLATLRQATLVRVCDTNLDLARSIAERFGGKPCANAEEMLQAADFEAVIIASPTNTHLDLLTRFAAAGVSVLCEKPIAIDLDEAAACWRALRAGSVPIQVAFHRRYDAGHAALARAVRAGEIGRLEFCSITSRDFAPPPDGYLESSGGIFQDMTIHDFDMIRFVTGEEPVAVCAMGGALFMPDARLLGDADTVAVVLTLASGAIAQVNCIRRAVYGHDQRIEAVGEKGMLISQNVTADAVERYSAQGTATRGPFIPSSRDRYRDAYRAEVADFVRCILDRGTPAVTLEDGYRALKIADAATRSLREGRIIAIDPDPDPEDALA